MHDRRKQAVPSIPAFLPEQLISFLKILELVLKLLRVAGFFRKPKITEFLNEGRRGERHSLTELITRSFNVSMQTQLEAEYRNDSGGTDRKKKTTTRVSRAQKRGARERERRGGFQVLDVISITTWMLR